MTTQSIIVYRNPLEAAFWESGIIFPVVVGIVLAACTATALNWLFIKYNKLRSVTYPKELTQWQSNWIVIGTIATMIATVWFMM